MQLGPHAAFIIGAYVAAALVIATLIGWVVGDYRAQRRTLMALEARGARRRSDRGEREPRLQDAP